MMALRRLKALGGRQLVIGIPFFWLFLFFLLPFIIVVKISFAEADVAIPPYTDVVSWADDQLTILLHMGNYLLLQEDELYIAAYLGSLKMAFISTVLCLLIGYPMAYSIARANKETQTVLLLLIMMPTWTAILIRVYAWMGILSNNGLLNSLLMGIGLINERSSTPTWRSTSASFTPTCRSWCCRSTPTWSSTIRACWRRPPTSAPAT